MKCFRLCLIFLLSACMVPSTVKAQYASASDYLNFLGGIEADMSRDYLSYMSAMAHTNSARKLDKRRQEVRTTIKDGQKKVATLKPFEGGVALREAYRKYLAILSAVMSEDYGK